MSYLLRAETTLDLQRKHDTICDILSEKLSPELSAKVWELIILEHELCRREHEGASI